MGRPHGVAPRGRRHRVDGLVFVSFRSTAGKPASSARAPRGPADADAFVQGTRDTFARGPPGRRAATLPRATLHAIPDADHGMHVPKRSGRTDADVLTETVDTIVAWIGRA
jgi:predicted alpha/beta-hydrolase family hydrolase